MNSVYIVIVNWNGWRDTIECLESVFRSNFKPFKVVVCDNASNDNSLEYMKMWAEGRLDVYVSMHHPLRELTFPPTAKPVTCVVHDRETAERGGLVDDKDADLIIVQTGNNLGFAGGSNVGIRYALARGDFSYLWLLNNDTVIKPDSLACLVGKATISPEFGICGSTLLYYDNASTVQAYGGAIYNSWLSSTRPFGHLRRTLDDITENKVESIVDYIIGASMLVSKSFVERVGLLEERYFLYFEELDWAERSKNIFKLAYSKNSIVYHKEGSTIGSNKNPILRSDISDYYHARNRLIFTKKFFKSKMFFVYISTLGIIINRLRRKQWKKSVQIIRILWSDFFE